MSKTRITDRKLLASFIEYAAEGKVTNSEWNRFAVEHYSDQIMESARAECVQLLIGHSSSSPKNQNTKNKLYSLAKMLREYT